MIRKCGLAAVAVALMVSTSAYAQKVEKEAVIVTVNGNTLNAKSREGALNVVVTPTTEISETSGIAKRTPREAKTLIPGLIFTVEGTQQGDTITASEIRYKERDWKTAISTKAGTTAEFAELRNAIIEGQEYVIQKEATVYFASGSAVVQPQYKNQLTALAQSAPSFGNYRISILGFADPRGNAEANERLSAKRADAVSNYLKQSGQIQPGRVLAPSAMGEGTAAPGESAPTSDDQARRVVVRVVTPKTQLTK
jgi:outer membrane protein OmpA-like peptidoglycan-associated protein